MQGQGCHWSSICPEPSFSASKMSLIKWSSRSALRSASAIKCAAAAGRVSDPCATSLMAPMIEASGVRSSWLAVDTNSLVQLLQPLALGDVA